MSLLLPKQQEAALAGAAPQEIAAASFKALDDNYLHLSGQEGKKRPREAALLQKLSNEKIYDTTSASYQSWVPSLLGNTPVKYQIRPCTDQYDPYNPEVIEQLNLQSDPNFLRGVLLHRLTENSTCFRISVQKHLEGFPSVEDAVAEWPRNKSAYVDVAEVTIPQKTEGAELTSEDFCETLSFNPAHATPEHRPIGGIQRARRLIYATIESARNKMRQKPVVDK